jgi:hypothetical protein
MPKKKKSKRGTKKKRWIQTLKEGSYKDQLKRLGLIKGDEKIPLSISQKIANADTNSTITIKGKRVKVTPLLKKRAVAHLTLVKLAKKRRK